jgi:hypothetical protein
MGFRYREGPVKNLSIALLFGVATLFIAGVASAQVNISLTIEEDALSPVNGTLQRFIVILDSQAGPITGLNIRLSDVDGPPSIHNVQGFNDPGTTPSPFESSSPLNLARRLFADTHLLFTDDELLAAGADATEPVDPTVADPNDGTRIDRFVGGPDALVSGNQGIIASAQQDPLPLLQVVLRPGDAAVLTGQVALAGETSPRNIGPFVVPEPNALALLAFGGLAMVRRRRAIR